MREVPKDSERDFSVIVALILQMAAIGFGDSMPTAVGRRKC